MLRILSIATVMTGLVISSASAAIIPLTVVNGGFETDAHQSASVTGWTTSNYWITDGTAGEDINSPNSGAKFLSADRRVPDPDASSFSSSTASQSIDLSAYAGGIDLGSALLDIDFFVATRDAADNPSALLEFFDGSSTSLGAPIDTGDLAGNTNGTWLAQTISGGAVAVPVGARSFMLTLVSDLTGGGSVIQVGFDDVSASIDVEVVPEASSLALFSTLGVAMLVGLGWRRRRANRR